MGSNIYLSPFPISILLSLWFCQRLLFSVCLYRCVLVCIRDKVNHHPGCFRASIIYNMYSNMYMFKTNSNFVGCSFCISIQTVENSRNKHAGLQQPFTAFVSKMCIFRIEINGEKIVFFFNLLLGQNKASCYFKTLTVQRNSLNHFF